jgi:signal transduction histidine kinase
MTDANKESPFCERELAFFGAVTASISHELNNAIAIIEQTAGLLEDLIAAGDSDEDVPKSQLQKIVDRIGNQTKRGATIVRRLNAFAHSVDDAVTELELHELIRDVMALANRMAERRRTELVARPDPSNGRVVISANRFRVQEALYLSIQKSVSGLPDGSRIEIDTKADGATAWISVESELSDSSPELDLSYLETLMDQLGGELESQVGNDQLAIRLTFPSTAG